MRRTKTTQGQWVRTAYLCHRRLPGLLEEWRHKVPPRSDLRSPGKISRLGEPPCSRWEFSQKRPHGGNQSFQELVPFLYFSGPLLYFQLYITFSYTFRDKWKIQSHVGSAVLTLIETTLSFCIPSDIQSSQVIYIIFWPRGLLTFYDPF